MDQKDGQVHADPHETIESLARTVAHLAVQVTIAQIQVRALGHALEDAGAVMSSAVSRAAAELARESARKYLAENLGPNIAAMIDLDDLEHQVIAYLSPTP